MKRMLITLVISLILLIGIIITHQHQQEIHVDLPRENGFKLSIEPNITRVIEVRRSSGEVEKYVKEGDPIVLPWYSLIANNLFGLRYTTSAFQVPNIDGVNKPEFDVGFGGCDTEILIYLSDEADKPTFTSYALPRNVLRITEVWVYDVSNINTYKVSIGGSHTHAGGSLVIRQLFVTLKYCSSGGVGEVLFLADAVEPPVYINSGDTVYVEWFISFPKPCPFLDGFWEAIKPFFGLRSSVDYGIDSRAGDTVSEVLFFNIGGRVYPFTKIEANVTESGLTLMFSGSHIVEETTELTSVVITLRTDTDTSDRVSRQHLQIFIGEGRILLDKGDVVTVALHVELKNLFN